MRLTPPATGPACGHPRRGSVDLIDGGAIEVCADPVCIAAATRTDGALRIIGWYRTDGPAAA